MCESIRRRSSKKLTKLFAKSIYIPVENASASFAKNALLQGYSHILSE
jgi:hypothetical protein